MQKCVCLVLAVLLLCLPLFGCRSNEIPLQYNYDFVNVDWLRDVDGCTETLRFRANGDFAYFCACGSPVDNYDLCEGYTYNNVDKIFELIFPSPKGKMVEEVKLVSCDGQTLVLDFGQQQRSFYREQVSQAPKGYVYLQAPTGMFAYSLQQTVEATDKEAVTIPHEKWDLKYYKGDVFVAEAQAAEASAHYGDDQNYDWFLYVDVPGQVDNIMAPLALTEEEVAAVYALGSEWEQTLFFDDVEVFASLVKNSKDGLLYASTSLAYFENTWYWRSEIINDTVEGWPEYVVPLPESLLVRIEQVYSPE